MPEHSFPALALDGDGNQVDALASDAGHLLWSGLLDKEYGELVGPAAAGAGLLLRLGRPHARRRASPRTTRSPTTGARCGRTTTR